MQVPQAAGLPMDIDELIRRNEALNAAENAGDLAALADMVAARLAFRRRDGTVVDREAFLAAARPGQRRLRIESVQVHGTRAVVACTVTDGDVVTHNLRLFAMDAGEWKLLGWANEPAI
jgi:Domain of unknown function (DUF4440)